MAKGEEQKETNKKYLDNFDRIFRKVKESKERDDKKEGSE